jgi:lysophospholipase L1-like esterase
MHTAGVLVSFFAGLYLALMSAGPFTPNATPDPVRLVPFGDSITHRNPTWAAVATQDGLQLVRNAGVDGNTTAQMLGRLDRDVLAYSPDVVTVMGGTNDRAKGVPLRTAMANLRTIVRRLHDRGVRVVLLTIPPNDGSVSAWNTAIRSVASSEGCALADIFPVLADSRGHWRAGLSADSVHPNLRGYELMQPVIAAALKEALPMTP